MKKLFNISLIAMLSVATCTVAATAPQQKPSLPAARAQAAPFITSAMVAQWVLSGAKSAITSKAKSFLGSLLFGSNGDASGPQIVRIHEEDLQKIAQLVSSAILTSDLQDARSRLESFGTTLEYYRDSVRGGNPDYAILPVLLDYTTSLSNHRAYKLEYNSTAYALTSSYALVSSMTIGVLTERHLQGYISEGFVKTQAQVLKQKLMTLGAASDKYAYGLGRVYYKGSRCFASGQGKTITTHDLPAQRPEYNAMLDGKSDVSPMAPAGCLITASLPGAGSVTFDAEDLGFFEADDLAYEWLYKQREIRAAAIKGENYQQVVDLLSSF